MDPARLLGAVVRAVHPTKPRRNKWGPGPMGDLRTERDIGEEPRWALGWTRNLKSAREACEARDSACSHQMELVHAMQHQAWLSAPQLAGIQQAGQAEATLCYLSG